MNKNLNLNLNIGFYLKNVLLPRSLSVTLLIFLVIGFSSSYADERTINHSKNLTTEQKKEIDHLISQVLNSGCIFNRNGSKHLPEEAVAHILKKYDYYSDDIHSAEQFIKFSASKSTMSGTKYTIECQGKKSVYSQVWLLTELKQFRASLSESEPVK